VDARQERAARNEAMYRAVNRQIEQESQEAGSSPEDELEILCECGSEGCSAVIALTIREYDEAHREPDRFVVVPGHEDPEIERVVSRSRNYVVVDKFGDAEKIVEADEPREGSD
jgi:hypothetical protein